jgi:hypothetical protein
MNDLNEPAVNGWLELEEKQSLFLAIKGSFSVFWKESRVSSLNIGNQ